MVANIKIVWGGVHPTLFAQQVVLDKAIDLCVVNECAATIVQIADALANNHDLAGVPGLCYKHNQEAVYTPTNLIADDFTNIGTDPAASGSR